MELHSTEDKPTLQSVLPIITEPRCNICKSSMRSLIDQLIVSGYSPMAIARQVHGTELKGSIDAIRKSVERHSDRHLNVREEALKRIIDNRAKERGILIDATEERLVTSEAVLDMIVSKGLEQIVDPAARVKYQDILKAVELQKSYESDSVAQQLDILQRQMWAIREAVKKVCPPELWQELVQTAMDLFSGADPFAEPETLELEPVEEEDGTRI